MGETNELASEEKLKAVFHLDEHGLVTRAELDPSLSTNEINVKRSRIGPATKGDDEHLRHPEAQRMEVAEDLQEAAGRSSKVGDEEMSDQVRWIRSYVLEEDGGSVGTVCIYQATSPEAIREHATRAVLPVDEIIPVADTVLVRPDPEPEAPVGKPLGGI